MVHANMIYEPYTKKEIGAVLRKRYKYFNDRLNEETVGDCLVREGKKFHILITLGTK